MKNFDKRRSIISRSGFQRKIAVFIGYRRFSNYRFLDVVYPLEKIFIRISGNNINAAVKTVNGFKFFTARKRSPKTFYKIVCIIKI